MNIRVTGRRIGFVAAYQRQKPGFTGFVAINKRSMKEVPPKSLHVVEAGDENVPRIADELDNLDVFLIAHIDDPLVP